ncbi:MAG: TonB-dependent receptor [Pseudomonadota bacterium]
MKTNRIRNSLLTGCASALFMIAATPAALAQDGIDDGSIDVLVVTAQRREQNVIDVPVSMTVLGQQEIQSYQIDELSDYVALAPNVGSSTLGSPLQLNLVIRGVRNIGGAVNSVGVYVDGINLSPTSNTDAYDSSLYDIERIEILRGPQSTHFGRNVTGGAVSITTVKPNDETTGFLAAEYGRFNNHEIRGAMNVPLTENLFFRGTAFYEGSDGAIDNIGPGGDSSIKNYGGRAAFRYQPNDRLTADLSIAYSDFEQGYPEAVPNGQFDQFLDFILTDLAGVSPDPRGDYGDIGFSPSNTDTINTNGEAEFTRDLLVATARVEYDFGPVLGILNGGLIQQEVTQSGDLDYLPGDYWSDDVEEEIDSYSIEARIQSNESQGLYWSAGLLYAQDESTGERYRFVQDDYFTEVFFVAPTGLAMRPDVISVQEDLVEIESFALFGDLSWTTADDRLTLEGGLRYAIDEVSESFNTGPLLDIPGGLISFLFFGGPQPFLADPDPVSGSETFNSISAKASATYAISDNVNTYVQVARGTKPGGFNLEAATDPTIPSTYESEVLWNYEAGVKGVFLGGDVLFNIAGFYSDWTDIQFDSLFLRSGGASPALVTQNAGEAEAYGIELDFAARLTDGLRINGGFGYLDGGFTGGDCPAAPSLGVCTTDSLGNPVGILDNELPNMSAITANLAVQYTQQISTDLEGFVRGEVGWTDEFFTNELNVSDPQDPNFSLIEGYETVNLRVGVENDRYRFVVFGENITNDGQAVGVGANGLASSFAGNIFAVRPSYYGARLTVSFGE